MLDIKKECPWCGMEIAKPKLKKGSQNLWGKMKSPVLPGI